MSPFVVIPLVVAAILVIALVAVFLYFLKVWIRALMSGARVSIWSLVGMKLRRVPPTLIVDARIRLIKAGLTVHGRTEPLEAHYLAGGDVVMNVVNALIAADKANIDADLPAGGRHRPGRPRRARRRHAPASSPRSSTARIRPRAQPPCSTPWPRTASACWSRPA